MTISLAKTSKEYLDLITSEERGFVRSKENWLALIGSHHNPLSKCPPHTIEKFTEGLEFKNGGLSHANYEMLMAHITLDDFVALWEHFGISKEYLILIDHHTCVSRGSCQYYFPAICTSNC